MLISLRVRNLAIVGEAEVGFSAGLNIVSGETGAGKSILLEAVALLLGARASSDWVRHTATEAMVEGLFDLAASPRCLALLDQLGYTLDDPSEFLVKRLISREGRHRVFLNGQLATLGILQKVANELVEVCSQHEHQRLGQSSYRVEMIDRFSGLTKKVSDFSERVARFHSVREELSRLDSKLREYAERREWVDHQLREIDDAGIQPGEEDELKAKKKLIQSVAERREILVWAKGLLSGDDDPLLDRVSELRKRLRTLVELDASQEILLTWMDTATSGLEELGSSVDRALSRLESPEEEIDGVATRLALLADLKRKHGRDLEGVLARQTELRAEISQGEGLNERRQEAEKQMLALRSELDVEFKELTRLRAVGARKLSTRVTEEARGLGMPSALVELKISSEKDTYRHLCSLDVLTNAGDTPRSIEKVASGGELSRFLLAIRTVVSEAAGTGVYVFDEIDVGISGQTAFQVGLRLRQIARETQVICVTHLPQVASFADHHVRVQKTESKGKTEVQILELDAQKRREEVARMLAGAGLTQASLKNADELMKAARKAGAQSPAPSPPSAA